MTDPSTPKRSGRWMRIALVLSVGLNLAVAGVVAGTLVKGPPERRSFGNSSRDMALPFTRALSRSDQRALRRELLGASKEGRDRHPLPTVAYREALDILRTDPFDAAAFDALMERESDRARTRMKRGQDALSAHLTKLSAADRLVYADRLEEQVERFEERVRDWGRQKPQ